MRYIQYAFMVAVLGCGSEKLTDASPQSGPGSELGSPNATTFTVQYDVVKLPSLGGTQSRGMAINAQGWVAGWSNLANGTRHAALWRDGSLLDLHTLGGPFSTVPWPGLNNEGMVVGISHTNLVDPLDEDWSCELAGFLPTTTNLICRGFVWASGVMRELPPLGGYHSFGAGINNLGQIVGWSETDVHDPTCRDAQVLQFRATVWDAKKNRIKARELRPYPGDSASAATAINDAGFAVGISGECDQAVGRFSALHAVLWDKSGQVSEIPNLGGVTWHTPMDINTHGDVVGFSNPPGAGDPEGEFIARAFLWTPGTTQAVDLKALPGDLFSQAFAINAQRQVVGVSFGGVSGARAFLYQDGTLINLNDLVAPGSLDVLLSAQDINDAGQITGRVLDGVTGEVRTFVATPVVAAP